MKQHSQHTLNALARIASIDGYVDSMERHILHIIAMSHGYTTEEMDAILENPEPVGVMEEFTPDEKLEFMYTSLSIMQADDLIYRSEVEFCRKLAERLNVDTTIVDLYSTRSDIDKGVFMKEARKYVKE